MNNTEVDIKQGTITFWLQPKRINYADNSMVPLIQLDPQNGSIFIFKDSDRKLKFFHVYIGKGRTDVEIDVSSLDQNVKHFFAFTWSTTGKMLKIFVDGKLKASQDINY